MNPMKQKEKLVKNKGIDQASSLNLIIKKLKFLQSVELKGRFSRRSSQQMLSPNYSFVEVSYERKIKNCRNMCTPSA